MPRPPVPPVRTVTVKQARELISPRDYGPFSAALANAIYNKQPTFIFRTSNGRTFLVQIEPEKPVYDEVGWYDGHGGAMMPSEDWLRRQRERQRRGRGAYEGSGTTRTGQGNRRVITSSGYIPGLPIASFIERMSSGLRRRLPVYYIPRQRLNFLSAENRGLPINQFITRIYMYCKRIENEGDLEEAVYDDEKFVFDFAISRNVHNALERFGTVDDDGYDTDTYAPGGE